VSTHFTISLGLIIACSAHVLIFLNFDINQEVKIIKKEEVLTVVLIKPPVIKPPVETPPMVSKPVVENKTTPPQKKSTKHKEKTVKKTAKNKKAIAKTPIIEEKEKTEEKKEEKEEEHQPRITEEKPLETPHIEENIPEVKQKIQYNGIKECSHCPKPHYPFVAKQRGIEGWVKLTLKIDETGSVIDAKILASEPEDIFEEAAKEAVLQWRNLPEQLFNSTVEQTIKFNLNN
jgi:periplasmic protein TonB